jgi:hypothetical protein
MGLFGKNQKEQERDRLFARLKKAAADGDVGDTSIALLRLRKADLLAEPETSFLIEGAITTLAQKNLDLGFTIAIWSMGFTENKELLNSVARKTLGLISRVDRNDMKMMATVAMAAGRVAEVTERGSETHKRGRQEWLAAMDILSARKDGLQFAFAAASNAAVGHSRDMPLREDAVEKWENIVLRLAKTDREAALAEAFRAAGNYDSFGEGALLFRARAAGVAAAINNMKP